MNRNELYGDILRDPDDMMYFVNVYDRQCKAVAQMAGYRSATEARIAVQKRYHKRHIRVIFIGTTEPGGSTEED